MPCAITVAFAGTAACAPFCPAPGAIIATADCQISAGALASTDGTFTPSATTASHPTAAKLATPNVPTAQAVSNRRTKLSLFVA